MNKEILDKLIESFVNEQRVESRQVAAQQSSGGSDDTLGIDISEIADIIVTGTEIRKFIKSSDAALDTLVANSNISFDLTQVLKH